MMNNFLMSTRRANPLLALSAAVNQKSAMVNTPQRNFR